MCLENIHTCLLYLACFLVNYECCWFQVLHSISTRESRLTQVEQAMQAFQWHRGLDTDAVGVVSALAGLRDASLEVVRVVVVSERTTLYRGVCSECYRSIWQVYALLQSLCGIPRCWL